MKKYILLFSITAFIASCKKDPLPETQPEIQQSAFVAGQGVFITNEGNFTFGNAKVSYYNFSNNAVTTDVFQPVNNRPLGDVCQSMSVINGKGYVVMNNSGKIEVVNMGDFTSRATITGFNAPRYILGVSSAKAYVSDLYSNAIAIVDLSDNQVSGSIPCNGWTEEMVRSGTNVYVANYEAGKVFVINTLTDMISDSITVTKGANSLQIDNAGKLWVMCSGESASSVSGALYKINTTTNTIESTMAFAASDSPWKLRLNGTSDTLYYLNHGIYKMWTGAGTLPTAPFIAQGGRNFYALGVNPANGKVFTADAIDYVQSGRVYVYSVAGTEQTNFLAGIIPGDFCFY